MRSKRFDLRIRLCSVRRPLSRHRIEVLEGRIAPPMPPIAIASETSCDVTDWFADKHLGIRYQNWTFELESVIMDFAFPRNFASIVSLTCAGLAFCPSFASAQNTQRGAVLGGLGGAVVGGLIGDHNDKAGAGAAIGGAIGAVSGAVLGNARDKEVNAQQQRQRYYAQQRVYTQQQQQYVQVQSAVSINDVISMSRSGLSDSVVINQIQTRGVQQQLQVSDIISMHQQGVSEIVIGSMQNARVGGAPTYVQPSPVIVQQTPVYVEERVIVPSYSSPPVYHIHSSHQHYRGSRYGF